MLQPALRPVLPGRVPLSKIGYANRSATSSAGAGFLPGDRTGNLKPDGGAGERCEFRLGLRPRTRNRAGNYHIAKPEHHTWESFTKLLLNSMPQKTAEHYRNKIASISTGG